MSGDPADVTRVEKGFMTIRTILLIAASGLAAVTAGGAGAQTAPLRPAADALEPADSVEEPPPSSGSRASPSGTTGPPRRSR
jgi:hypothetical protein